MFEKIPPGKPKQTIFTKAQQKAMAVAQETEQPEGFFFVIRFLLIETL